MTDALPRKRSVVVNGHRTSVSLEQAFWQELAEIARRRNLSLGALITEIDHARTANLSSAIRVYILEWLKAGHGSPPA